MSACGLCKLAVLSKCPFMVWNYVVLIQKFAFISLICTHTRIQSHHTSSSVPKRCCLQIYVNLQVVSEELVTFVSLFKKKMSLFKS